MPDATQKKSVLLLDDDKFLVEMYAMKFQQQGFAVMSATSVADAINDIKGGFAPDAIIFDLVMPGRDGLSFLASLQEEKLAPRAVKIALTNQYDDIERQKAVDMGADRCVVKASIIPSEVVSLVSETIAAKK